MDTRFMLALLVGAVACDGTQSESYDPVIEPASFAKDVTHPLFPYTVGRTWTYREAQVKTVEITVLPDRKTILGVSCITVHDVLKAGDAIEEDTFDWYAQDVRGNVWYFGEDTKELDAQGNVVTTAGTWLSGTKGAKPGMIMPADPRVGDEWREEYLKGEAEDAAKAVSTNVGIAVPVGTFTGCLKTFNFTPLNPTSNELKVYCPGVGPVWTMDLATDEVEELLSVSP